MGDHLWERMLSRRGFLGQSSSALVAAVLPWKPLTTSIAISPVIGYVLRLSTAFGARVLSRSLGSYVGAQSASLRNQVARINSEMIRDGFDDFEQAWVHGWSGHFYYPVIHRDGFNACVAFFNNDRGSVVNLAAMIEGPTIVGLAFAAEDLARGHSRSRARQVLNPKGVISRGTGTFASSYSQPDEYETEAGRVRMNYTNDGPGRGTVAVLAEGPLSSGRWGGLFQRDYSIAYTA